MLLKWCVHCFLLQNCRAIVRRQVSWYQHFNSLRPGDAYMRHGKQLLFPMRRIYESQIPLFHVYAQGKTHKNGSGLNELNNSKHPWCMSYSHKHPGQQALNFFYHIWFSISKLNASSQWWSQFFMNFQWQNVLKLSNSFLQVWLSISILQKCEWPVWA